MESELIFSENNKSTKELLFAIRMNVDIEKISELKFQKLLLSLRKSERAKFFKSEFAYSKGDNSGTIWGKNNERQIIYSGDMLEYRESTRFDKTSFNSICKQLNEFYFKDQPEALQNVKLVGKVYTFEFNLNGPSLETLKSGVNVYKNRRLFFFELKTTFVEEELNIHVYVKAKEDEESTPDEKTKSVRVRLDVNNNDQLNGIPDDMWKKVIEGADNYSKDGLLEALNENFKVLS